MSVRRHGAAFGALALIATTATFAAGGPAFAAGPGNDLMAGAIAVGVGFSDTVDTTGATTDADDTGLTMDCQPPATDASVWYTVTPETDGGVVVDVSGSDYPAGVIVASGGPGEWYLENCGPGTVGFYGYAGTTYTILAFDDQSDETGNGGTLAINIADAPPPPSIDVTVDKFAAFDSRSGSATVTGQVTCSGDAEYADLEIGLSQQVGRVSTVRGWGWTGLECDGVTRPWSVRISPDNGKFAGGKAASVTFAFACGSFDCADDYSEHIIQLRGKK